MNAVRSDLDDALSVELETARSRMRSRTLPPPARGADFSSNDYLGLARNPAVIRAASDATAAHGAGGRASRLLGGGSGEELALERDIARWLGAEAALLFASGYHANVGVVGALVGPGDAIVCDELSHASLIDGARLSRARVYVHRHGDVEAAERCMRGASAARRVLVLTESVFSMDGDVPPLAALAAACKRHGAWLLVDEAHACGLLGPNGAGAWAACGASCDSLVRIVTGGKALGASGALAVGSAAVRAHLVQSARTFLFTTATPPGVTAALHSALRIASTDSEGRERALHHALVVAAALDLPEPAAAIVPFVVGSERAALDAAAQLHAAGLDVRAVRPPTVPPGTARLRIVCHAHNTMEEVERLIAALRAVTRLDTPLARPDRAQHAPLFVTGTDTGVGKTVVSALIVRAACELGRVAYWKPIQTGEDDDVATVRALSRGTSAELLANAYRFALPASPHTAAAAEEVEIDVGRLDAALDGHCERSRVVVELAGGLCVPLTSDFTQIDWLARRRPRLALVARSGLGTLNHTLLSLEALRARSLEPAALFLVGEPHAENRATLAQLAFVPVIFEVPCWESLGPDSLAEWLAAHDLTRLLEP